MPQTVSERQQMHTTAEIIGLELKETLPLRRIDSLSIHDRNGELVWLSENTLGPDEHNAVLEAITVFEVEGNRSYVSEELGDGRSAAFFASSTPHGELVAVVMAIADSHSVDTLGTAKLVTPKVRSLMQRLAILLKPPRLPNKRGRAAGAQDDESSTISELAALRELENTSRTLDDHGAASANPAAATEQTPPVSSPLAQSQSPAVRRLTAIRPAVVLPAANGAVSIEQSPVPLAPVVSASQASVASSAPEIVLHVQQLMKLRSGGRTRRYEVLVRGASDAADAPGMSEQLTKALALRETAAAIDRAVASELVSWLRRNPAIWNADPASFSVNLSLGSLLEPNFTAFVNQLLQSSGVAPDTIGFEVPEHAFLKHRDACTSFLAACEKMGCYVVIDDFSMHSDVVPFMASRALRVVKIDPKLTQAAMRDRLSQALVIAISQASKVLGLHCVAKRIDNVATRQWLAAVGIDFAQGFALENPRPLASLAEAKEVKPR